MMIEIGLVLRRSSTGIPHGASARSRNRANTQALAYKNPTYIASVVAHLGSRAFTYLS